jgi:iron-sulfur cluster assembly protein
MSEQVVQLTPIAIDKILSARAAEGFGADHALRLSVKKGGCSGYEYSVKFVAEPLENDVIFDTGRIRVFVDRDSEALLRGTVLDYVDGLYGAGLRFVNPNAGHECGCGSSFSAAEAGSGSVADPGSGH